MKNENNHVVTVFGSSRTRQGEHDYEIAYNVGRELATAGFTVCNGGYGGTMEASARGAKDAGGDTIGVITKSFPGSTANRWIKTVIEENTLVDRLLKLVSLGDAYVVLRGGTGTLLELAAVWEFMNKNIIREKPIVVVGGFWNGVVKTLKEELAWEGVGDSGRFVTLVDSPDACAAVLRNTMHE